MNEETLSPEEELIGDQIASCFYGNQEDLEKNLKAILSSISPDRRAFIFEATRARLYGEKAQRREYLASVLNISGSRDEIDYSLISTDPNSIQDQEAKTQLEYFLHLTKSLYYFELLSWQRQNGSMISHLASQPIEKLEAAKKELTYFTNEFYSGGYKNLKLFKPHQQLVTSLTDLSLTNQFDNQETIIRKVIFSEYLNTVIAAIVEAKQRNIQDIPTVAAAATLQYSKILSV